MTERLMAGLVRRANRTGLVLARGDRLTEDLACSHEELQQSLHALEQGGRVRILSPLPFLVLALLPRPWPGRRRTVRQDVQQFRPDPARSQQEVPVSSSFAAAAIQSREVGVAGEGEALLDEVLAALGFEADRDEFRSILRQYSPGLVRRCLRRVHATKDIRVSRAALFRSLLVKLSH